MSAEAESVVTLSEEDKRELKDACVYNPNPEKAASILDKYPGLDINTYALGVSWVFFIF